MEHGRTPGTQLRASAERCLREIAAELGVDVERLPPRILAAVTALGLECGQMVLGHAERERYAEIEEDAVTQVGWRRRR